MKKEKLYALVQMREENRKKLLKYMRRYQAYLQNGISYKQLYMLMAYDRALCFKKIVEHKSIVPTNSNLFIPRINAQEKGLKFGEEEIIKLTLEREIKFSDYFNRSTNMHSVRDASRKMHALQLARENLEERQKKEEEAALKQFQMEEEEELKKILSID